MGGVATRIQKSVMGEEEKYDFPDTLEGFGYKFNQAGQLRHMETDEPYEFNVREGDHHYNQKYYNALGDVLTEYIYKIMENECKLQRSYLPVDAEANEPQSFVFISGDLYTNPKMLLLIHGSGAVRAGQWARRLIINDCLDSGSQLPYIRWARQNGYAVVVANTNINTVELTEKRRKSSQVKIRGNSSPEEHTESVWREFVQRSAARHIAVVAHSYGGVCVLDLAMKHIREFEDRVFAIALTDSVHGMRQQEARPEVIDFYKQRAVNWASAYDPLDAHLITTQDEVPTVSAGTDRHENTSHSASNSVFKYFTERYDERIDPSKRISIGEHSVLHNSPSLNEHQGLVSRGQAVGQDDGEPADVAGTQQDGTQQEKADDERTSEMSNELGTKIDGTQQDEEDDKMIDISEEHGTKNDGTKLGEDDDEIIDISEEHNTEVEVTAKTLEENQMAETNMIGSAGTQEGSTDSKETIEISTEHGTGIEGRTVMGEETTTAEPGNAGTNLEKEDVSTEQPKESATDEQGNQDKSAVKTEL